MAIGAQRRDPTMEDAFMHLVESVDRAMGVAARMVSSIVRLPRAGRSSMTQQQAILDTFAPGVPAVLMSRFATPVEGMPLMPQWSAQAIPLPHFLIIGDGSFLTAMPHVDILADRLWPLTVIALATLTMATFLVRGRRHWHAIDSVVFRRR